VIFCSCCCIGSGDITAVLHVLELLKSVISEFPKNALKTTCELIIGLLGIHNTVCVISFMHSIVRWYIVLLSCKPKMLLLVFFSLLQ